MEMVICDNDDDGVEKRERKKDQARPGRQRGCVPLLLSLCRLLECAMGRSASGLLDSNSQGRRSRGPRWVDEWDDEAGPNLGRSRGGGSGVLAVQQRTPPSCSSGTRALSGRFPMRCIDIWTWFTTVYKAAVK